MIGSGFAKLAFATTFLVMGVGADAQSLCARLNAAIAAADEANTFQSIDLLQGASASFALPGFRDCTIFRRSIVNGQPVPNWRYLGCEQDHATGAGARNAHALLVSAVETCLSGSGATRRGSNETAIFLFERPTWKILIINMHIVADTDDGRARLGWGSKVGLSIYPAQWRATFTQ